MESVFWAEILAGIVLLFFGRRLFWFFVAVAGFLLGADAAARWISGDTWLVWTAAILIGVGGALLAVFLQKAAVVIAGGLAGAWLALQWAEAAGLASPIPVIAAIALGLIAAVMTYFVFEWALILLSSIVGASLIAGPLPLEPVWKGAAGAVLLVAGVCFQFLATRRAAAAPPPP